MQLMKLNLGSGDTPKRECLNFDALYFERRGARTDVIGRIEAMPFKNESFDRVLCSHVIEHFDYEDALELLRIIFDLLKRGGFCAIEGPCILGGYEYYVVKRDNVKRYIAMLYGLGPIARRRYGKLAQHKSGWTGPILAEAMKNTGFKIKYVGPGRTHGMGKRDFRVEGGKP